MAEKDDFNNYLPKITEETIIKAASSFGIGEEIISLDGKRTGIDSFILNLATGDQVHGPFLMNSTCARALYNLLADEGFGPQKA